MYCHCPDPDRCGELHAIHDDVPNDDIAAYQVRLDLKRHSDADELYHDLSGLMHDLVHTGGDWQYQPGDAWVVDLATGKAYDAAEFRDANR